MPMDQVIMQCSQSELTVQLEQVNEMGEGEGERERTRESGREELEKTTHTLILLEIRITHT